MDKLRTSWRPEYADSEIVLGRWTMPRGPESGEIDERWQIRRLSPAGLEVRGFSGREFSGKRALFYSSLAAPTLAVNEAELVFGVSGKDSGLHRVWLLWQLDGARWFGRQFDFAYDGVVSKLTFRLSGSREWFLADELSGLCLVFEEEPDTIQVESFDLMFGLKMGLGLMHLPGADEQLDLALEDILKVR